MSTMTDPTIENAIAERLTGRLISADSHVVEPGDLWSEHLPDDLADRGPRAVRDPDNHHTYLSMPDHPRAIDLTLSRTAGMAPGEVDRLLADDPTRDVGARGGFDPDARLTDMDRDGVAAEVLYPTAGLSLLQLEDPPLQDACFRIYNDWLADFCSTAPSRLLGYALISVWDIDDALAEVRRAAELGHRGIIIWTAPPVGESFFSPRYEPLWATASEMNLPISLHTLAGHRQSKQLASFSDGVESSFYLSIGVQEELQRSICELIASGVFARHPDLRVIGAEGGIYYAASMERRLDASFKHWSARQDDLTEPPSFYFRRNVGLTYITDPIGLNNLSFTGADHFMWSSDYPHGAGTWPDSIGALQRDATAASLDFETVERLAVTNASELYGLDT
ncbi:MAG: amidohydrolase family protein [Ilumatobacteraceae bacterium]|nr:amidohydrolase family protein [Ilumatobacteraceae bacterium]